MHIQKRILHILGSVSGPGYIHVDRLQRELNVAPAALDAALREMEERGGVEFTGPGKLYVRATGRWFTVAA